MTTRKTKAAIAALATGALVWGLATPALAEDGANAPAAPAEQTTPEVPTTDGPATPETTPGAETPTTPGEEAPTEEPATEEPTAPTEEPTVAPTTEPTEKATEKPKAKTGEQEKVDGGVVNNLWSDSYGYRDGKVNKRVSGADRFATAVQVSKHGYSRAGTVIVASGLDYPDALSAAALGAKLKAPLLLTLPNKLPSVTKAEIKRLGAKRVIIAGGTGAVNSKVAKQLKPSGGKVERLAGKDRYSTSIAIAKKGWGTGTSRNAFVATGTGFADALSAGAAAGYLNAPVILVPGKSSSASSATKSLLKKMGVTRVGIAGGTGAVSSRMEKSLKVSSSVKIIRYAGADRYATSAKIANGVFMSSGRTYWASGAGFADALAGSAVAGAKRAPLLLSQPSCIRSYVYTANDKLSPTDTFLLGGTGALSNTVRNGNECMKRPAGASSGDFAAMAKLYSKINQARYSAGLTGYRVADNSTQTLPGKKPSTIGTPAYSWSVNMSKNGYRRNAKLASQQRWVQYEVVGYNNYPNRVEKAWSQWMGNRQTAAYILSRTGNFRGSVSIGYKNTRYAYTTLYVGVTNQG